SSPAIVNGRIYFTTTEETFCLGKPDHKSKPDRPKPTPEEAPLPKGAKAAHLQVVPADVTLSPGESAEFTVRAFDEAGGLIGEARVRVAPALPYVQDFEFIPIGGIPGGWVNTQGKFTVITLPDGSKVLSKRNDLSTPLVAVANAYMSLPWLAGYGIEG